MREILGELLAALETGQPVAYCRLVETRGSTPQKAGAAMLVFADGRQAGTLGGGCVEAEVKRRAIAKLDAGESEIAKFQLDNDYGWDDGLICGGRMLVLIQPVTSDSAVKAYFQQLTSAMQEGCGITECIVFDSKASQLVAPASYLFDNDQQFVMSLPASATAPDAVREQLRPLSERPRPSAAGGIACLPILPRCRLVIVGAGHVGQAIGRLAAELDFDVWVVDDRQEYVSEQRFPAAQHRIAGSIHDVLPALEITADTYCLIVTRGHNHDEEALYYLAERGARYVGLIGSRRKIKMIFEDLLEEGISPAALEQVYAPLGIDIGSQTVMEIAVSICAELVAHRNCDGVIPGRPARIPVRS